MTESKQQDVLFILSIDTEEEWDWNSAFPESECAVANVDRLPQFHAFCQSLGIRPTYFTDYAVADNAQAASTLKAVLEQKDSELGAHLHPWCNPPYYGTTTEFESHLVNLPKEQVAAKLDQLLQRLTEVFDVAPKSFRSGRWGIDGKGLELLAERGIEVDSSVYPFYRNDFFSCESAPLDSYWPSFQHALEPGNQRQILEMPVSVGFNQSNFERAERWYNQIAKPPLSHFHLIGLLWRLKLLRKLYLCPELCDGDEMVELVDVLLKRGQPVLHMYLHSSSFVDGVTGLMDTQNSLDQISQRIKRVVEHLQAHTNLTCCTLTEAATILKNRNGHEGVLR